MTTIISIGVDCGNATFLKANNLRTMSFPFDWVVTYHGVADIIKTDFADYIPKDTNSFNAISDTYFLHYHFPQDVDKIERQIARFRDLLETSDDKIAFIRKGHACHNHGEQNGRYNIMKSDIVDAEELDAILRARYPPVEIRDYSRFKLR